MDSVKLKLASGLADAESRIAALEAERDEWKEAASVYKSAEATALARVRELEAVVERLLPVAKRWVMEDGTDQDAAAVEAAEYDRKETTDA